MKVELKNGNGEGSVKIDIPVPDTGILWIRPEGYGDATAADGHGYPIGIEVWEGRLRVILHDDINKHDPTIIDMEKARESNRREETGD